MAEPEKLPQVFGNISLGTTRRCMAACREAAVRVTVLCRVDARNVVGLMPGTPYKLIYMRHWDGRKSRMEWTLNPAMFRRDMKLKAERALVEYVAAGLAEKV